MTQFLHLLSFKPRKPCDEVAVATPVDTLPGCMGTDAPGELQLERRGCFLQVYVKLRRISPVGAPTGPGNSAPCSRVVYGRAVAWVPGRCKGNSYSH